MFVDEAVIVCSAGHGGKGCHSLDRSRPGAYRANGGDGGHGGSIYLIADPQMQTLLDFQYNREFTSDRGANGSSSFKRGRDAEDRYIRVPVGTQVLDEDSAEFLKDLNEPGASLLLCKGGEGGKGNDKRNSATDGDPGEHKRIRLRLKLLADVGLLGFPNAGKSTLLNSVSNARSIAAAYPFTTKNPILGVVKFPDDGAFVMADIPGIIEGAASGRGMGLDFLKHVERTRVLIHVIDFAGFDGRDPLSDYQVLNQELAKYSKELAQKPQIIAANKMDVPQAVENLKVFKKKIKKKVYPISGATGEGVSLLLKAVRQKLSHIDED